MSYYRNKIPILSFLVLLLSLLINEGLTTVSAQEEEDTKTTTCSSDGSDGSCDASQYLADNNNNNNNKEEKKNSNSRRIFSTMEFDNVDVIKEKKECKDNNEECDFWADYGECENNPSYMLKQCRFSCGLCEDDNDLDDEELRSGTDFGIAQVGIDYDNEFAIKIRQNIVEARKYMKRTRNRLDPELMKACTNEHEQCTEWAILGECDENPNYMKRKCGPACKSCEYLNMKERCKFDHKELTKTNVWGPGDLNKMFEKLTSEPYLSKYEVQIMSSPETTNGPWVIVMENVLNEYEAERLIELGTIRGYKRSTGVGKLLPDGSHEAKVITTRTSTNAWCEDTCYDDEVTQTIVQRLSNITDIPDTNAEYLQLLKYEEGQFYNTHHDCIVDHGDLKIGVRVLTAFMYLNDVASGGETEFPKLKLKVSPKRGRMVVWPSVLDDKPTKKDARTMHGALKVTEGIKYGANAWFHIRDYKTPHHEGCT